MPPLSVCRCCSQAVRCLHAVDVKSNTPVPFRFPFYEAVRTILPNDELVIAYNKPNEPCLKKLSQWPDKDLVLQALDRSLVDPHRKAVAKEWFDLLCSGRHDAVATVHAKLRNADSYIWTAPASSKDEKQWRDIPHIRLLHNNIVGLWRRAELHIGTGRTTGGAGLPFFCALVRSRHCWTDGAAIIGIGAPTAATSHFLARQYYGTLTMFALDEKQEAKGVDWDVLRKEGLGEATIKAMTERIKVTAGLVCDCVCCTAAAAAAACWRPRG